MGNCASSAPLEVELGEHAHTAKPSKATDKGNTALVVDGDVATEKDQQRESGQRPDAPRPTASPLSTSPSTALTRLSGAAGADGRNLVLIVWDIENVRLPLSTAPGLTPKNVVRYLKKHFIYGPGRTEFRTVAALTERSLGRIRRDHPSFVEQVVPDLTLLLASAVHQKRNADVVLKKELHHFVTEHAHLARSCPGQLSIVLISGDEDFLEGVQGALAAGFAVELVTHDTASGALLAQGYARPPTLWSRFLRDASGVADVVLPYGDEQMAGVLGPRSVVLAGFGPRRGGEAARAQAARLLRAAVATLHASGTGAGAGVAGSGGSHGSSAGGAVIVGGGGAAQLPGITLVEPSFGAFSGSCVVLVTPRDGDDAAALAERLRTVQLPPEPGTTPAGGPAGAAGAGAAGSSQASALLAGEQRLAVLEARRLLCLQLHADELWVPNQGHQADEAASELLTAGADDEAAAAGGGGYGVAGEDAAFGEAAGGGGSGAGSFSAAASGRGLHDRLADACQALAGVITTYRLPRRPGGSPSKHPQQHHPQYPQHPQQQQQQQGLQVLCRFTRVPAPGELCLTLLAAAADEAADLLAVLSHLQAAAAPQLRRQHGVTLTAQLMFSADEVASAAETAAARAAGAGVAAEKAGALGNAGLLGALEQQQAARHRLPSLAYTPQPHVHAGQPGPLPGATPGAQPAEAAGAPPLMGAGEAPSPVGAQAAQPAVLQGDDREDEDEGHDQKGKKKKKKKRNKKKRGKKNKVVPL
ncbi:hypothetical protein HXX76_008219 [Chlamydomonas incerta]|uniref:NYN domain-containing protein n=1 Tax=Chlamydomonas incerta TaxID=51695 RepID=A0A835T969_CHLIN|nr:hypothetical protein HXX76_008219 [Chlamydomonas incerta]|eukprot:KAG2433865.1 hypothetical protein HXX76_008219 [Chlamydomonas incerta]